MILPPDAWKVTSRKNDHCTSIYTSLIPRKKTGKIKEEKYINEFTHLLKPDPIYVLTSNEIILHIYVIDTKKRRKNCCIKTHF